MLFNAAVQEAYDKLSSEDQSKVISYIFRLSASETYVRKKGKFPFDAFKNGEAYMADDFDEIPEGFEDYI